MRRVRRPETNIDNFVSISRPKGPNAVVSRRRDSVALPGGAVQLTLGLRKSSCWRTGTGRRNCPRFRSLCRRGMKNVMWKRRCSRCCGWIIPIWRSWPLTTVRPTARRDSGSTRRRVCVLVRCACDRIAAGLAGKEPRPGGRRQPRHGDWLLFTDANVTMAPDTLGRAVSYAQHNGLEHLAMTPGVVMPSLLLQSFVLTFVTFFCIYFQPWKARDPQQTVHRSGGVQSGPPRCVPASWLP